MEIVERKTLILRDQLYRVNQGKVLKDKKTMEKTNIGAEGTIDMCLRIMGGMRKEEQLDTSDTEEDFFFGRCKN